MQMCTRAYDSSWKSGHHTKTNNQSIRKEKIMGSTDKMEKGSVASRHKFEGSFVSYILFTLTKPLVCSNPTKIYSYILYLRFYFIYLNINKFRRKC